MGLETLNYQQILGLGTLATQDGVFSGESSGTNTGDQLISVGTTTTGAPGSSASVSNSGTPLAPVLNFTIPRGDTGATGLQGIQGIPGTTGATGSAGADGKTVRNGAGVPSAGLGVDGDFYINTTASTIYGPKAAGSWGAPTNLVGPQGAQGLQGIQGIQGIQGVPGTNGSNGATGATGPAGPGLPAGGTVGQLIRKSSATDYATEWITHDFVSTSRTINSLPLSANQTFAIGTSGSNFNIVSATGVHTFNIPDAGPSARGLVTTGAQTLAGDKTLSGNLVVNGNVQVRQGTTPRTLDVFNTYTSDTVFESGCMAWNAGGTTLFIGMKKGSVGGSTRVVHIGVGDVVAIQLSVGGGVATYGLPLNDRYSDSGSGGLIVRRARGTQDTPSPVLSGDSLGIFAAVGYHSGGAFLSSYVGLSGYWAQENFTPTAGGTSFRIYTTPLGTITNSLAVFVNPDGNVGFGGVTNPNCEVDVGGDTIRIRTARTPATSTSAGSAGMLCWDATYLYGCVSTNSWRRIAWSTF